jgi:hypothetical protein
MSVRVRRAALPLLTALVTLVTPAAARSQDAAPPPATAPTADNARAGVSAAPVHAARAAREGAREQERAPRNRPGFGQPEALMIVGGAGVVLGLLIGDTAGNVLAFGGAVVGLTGLYQYLR